LGERQLGLPWYRSEQQKRTAAANFANFANCTGSIRGIRGRIFFFLDSDRQNYKGASI